MKAKALDYLYLFAICFTGYLGYCLVTGRPLF